MNFLTGFVLILILFSQATGFVLPTIDGFLEGYGVEDSGLQPGGRGLLPGRTPDLQL